MVKAMTSPGAPAKGQGWGNPGQGPAGTIAQCQGAGH